jgi:probable rRNA maturation factor
MRRTPNASRPRVLTLQNRQRAQRVDTTRLKHLVTALLRGILQQQDYEIGIYLVSSEEISRLNETYLRHQGPTDVITFNYGEEARTPRPSTHSKAQRVETSPAPLHGEIFVCVPEAVAQALRFRTTWQNELIRYIIHGLLHLLGYDDSRPGLRRRMKREEDRLLHDLVRS